MCLAFYGRLTIPTITIHTKGDLVYILIHSWLSCCTSFYLFLSIGLSQGLCTCSPLSMDLAHIGLGASLGSLLLLAFSHRPSLGTLSQAPSSSHSVTSPFHYFHNTHHNLKQPFRFKC